MNEFLSKTDTTLIFVRGNNDDPSFYNEKKIDFSHIKTIPDYSVIITKKEVSFALEVVCLLIEVGGKKGKN